MATRKLLYISRTLVQPVKPLFQAIEGSTRYTTQPLVQPIVFRTFCNSQITASSSSSQSSQTEGSVKDGKLKDQETPQHAQPKDFKHFSIDDEQHPPSVAAQDAMDPTMVPRDTDYNDPNMGIYAMPHPIWSEHEVNEVVVTHRKPQGFIDTMAMYSVMLLRGGYDVISGYSRKHRDEALWLKRIIFLETVAGVPGMVAAMVRHLNSLRMMQRDHGWIHTLLEEAENERMHLMTAMQLKQPSMTFRTLVVGAQCMFVSMFSVAYLLSPRFCHRFVGYLEEEAVVTYTKCLLDIDNGPLKHWQTQTAPPLAIRYWSLAPAATMRDVILAIRADEAHHRKVNHSLASMKPDEWNPHKPGE